MTTNTEAGGIGRRDVIVAGGAALGLGALLAACGSSAASEPGRVGYAPVPTALPNEVLDDVVYLRTAQSIERTIVEVYGTLLDSGALGGAAADLVARLVDDHTATGAEVGELVSQAGGEPYDCVNSWYMDRVVPPIFETINGNGADIEPSDDPARDMLAVVDSMESMAASMYQGLVERLSEPGLRADVMVFGARSARHSAVTAIISTGAPEAYVSPAVRGEEVVPGESGLVPLFAIPTQFGTLSPYSLVIGAASSAGTRATLPIETPADNSYVYADQTCSA